MAGEAHFAVAAVLRQSVRLGLAELTLRGIAHDVAEALIEQIADAVARGDKVVVAPGILMMKAEG